MMKEYIKRYWSDDAGNYNKSIQTLMRSQRSKAKWQDLFIEVMGRDKLKVLDVGTGPGIISLLLAELGHNVTGIDFSSEMLANAKNNAAAFGLSVRFEKGDAENLPFAPDSFDAVVNRYVLWTVTNPNKAISEWRRVIKPGGRVVIIDGNWYANEKTLKRALWQRFSTILIMASEHRDPRHEDLDDDVKNRLWSIKARRPQADVELLEKAGFKDIRIVNGVNARTQDFMDFLKSGYWGDTFLVTGIK
ncbi:MAG TPA: methyltransferase domain-containing protein [Methanothrix sp.]|nr:methyltransferase domain-containing protein [Methanothrix sp.]